MISRNLSRRVEQLERRAIPARKWMIELANPNVGKAEAASNGVLFIVLPRTDGASGGVAGSTTGRRSLGEQ